MTNLYKDIIVDGICGDIKKARDVNIMAGAVILTYSAIDAMAFLSMPISQKEVSGKDYILWVNKYLKAAQNQSYQYEGVDLYAARCGIVHTYGFESKISRQGKCKIFAYHNGSEHLYKPKIDKRMVLISSRRLIKRIPRG